MAVDLATPVLVVDDQQVVVRIIEGLLRSLGFSNIEGVGSGDEALAKLAEKPYGLVISDWHMEPMSGYEFLVRLRNEGGKRAQTPFIMVTADGKTESVVAARKAGADSYMVKPFNAQALKGRIATVFGDV